MTDTDTIKTWDFEGWTCEATGERGSLIVVDESTPVFERAACSDTGAWCTVHGRTKGAAVELERHLRGLGYETSSSVDDDGAWWVWITRADGREAARRGAIEVR